MIGILQAAITATTLATLYLSGKKSVWAQRVAILAQFAWWAYYIVTEQWGLMPMQAAISVLVVRAFILWERDYAEGNS